MTELLEVNIYSPEYYVVRQAVEVLQRGELVVIPTEGVYTIAGSLSHKKSLPALQKIKGGKADFSIMVNNLAHISNYTRQLDRTTYRLLNKALPGPYTFILEANQTISKLFEVSKKSIGIRYSDHEVPNAIIEALGCPLLCTSVNDEDEILQYTTDPSQIAENLDGKVALVLDGGYGSNEPSSVIDCTGGAPQIVRVGAGDVESLL